VRERCVTLFAALMLFAVTAWSAGMVLVRGALTCDSCNNYTGYSVELQEIYGNRAVERAIIRANGEFTVYVPTGTYILTVVSGGTTVKTETVTVRDGFGSLSVEVPNLEVKQRPATGIISIARLKHKPPKQAQKEYKAAHKKYEAGDLDASLEHLKRATEIDAEYLEAWNNLGCRYLMKGQPAAALAALQRAAAIDRNAPFIHTNMSIAQLAMGYSVDAEASARAALSVDPTDKKARYLLGLSLVAQEKYSDEALKLLRQVADDFPTARIPLAETLAKRGNVEQARTILQTHLSTADQKTRPQVEAMISSLNH
jgi:tetratricopeptide (TPR) repeat protein